MSTRVGTRLRWVERAGPSGMSQRVALGQLTTRHLRLTLLLAAGYEPGWQMMPPVFKDAAEPELPGLEGIAAAHARAQGAAEAHGEG